MTVALMGVLLFTPVGFIVVVLPIEVGIYIYKSVTGKYERS